MRNDYVLNAAKVIDDPYILVNVVSRRVKQLRHGYRPLIESLEKLSLEDTALREIAERKITYEIATQEQLEEEKPVLRSPANRSAQPRPVAFRAHNVLVGAKAE
jgi:DNA-directed RNA polymerase subunit omega